MGLSPWYVTGFVDGEGSFYVTKTERKATFAITLRADDAPILKEIQAYFGGCGRFTYIQSRKPYHPLYALVNTTKPTMGYLVTKTSDLVQYIIPHFDAYPLQAKKQYPYRAWREFVLLHYQTLRKRGMKDVLAPMISNISRLNNDFAVQLSQATQQPTNGRRTNASDLATPAVR